MDKKFCYNCLVSDVMFHEHHIVPKSNGGTENKTNKATLCLPCHGKAHGIINYKRTVEKSIEAKKQKADESRYKLFLKWDATKQEVETYKDYSTLIYDIFMTDRDVCDCFIFVVDAYKKGEITFERATDILWVEFCAVSKFHDDANLFDHFIAMWLVNKSYRKMLLKDIRLNHQ